MKRRRASERLESNVEGKGGAGGGWADGVHGQEVEAMMQSWAFQSRNGLLLPPFSDGIG